jgi:hypothetical protein
LSLRVLFLANLLAVMGASGGPAGSVPASGLVRMASCPSSRPRMLLGLLTRQLTLAEMVSELERGCLALEEVRFNTGQDTIESLSPAQFAMVARALGLAQGAYRVSVPPEAAPGSPPDTLQARRRGVLLRDELIHYGASSARLREDSGWPISPLVAAPGAAIPMLVRVPDPR